MSVPKKTATKAAKKKAPTRRKAKPAAATVSHIVDWSSLEEHAHAAQALAYAPYSKFHVGAALLTASGNVFAGCNVENASYGLALCAERSAVAQAIAFGERDFVALVVSGGKHEPATPCGMCRQVLFEFAPELPVVCTDGTRTVAFRLSELLPSGFGPDSLLTKPAKRSVRKKS